MHRVSIKGKKNSVRGKALQYMNAFLENTGRCTWPRNEFLKRFVECFISLHLSLFFPPFLPSFISLSLPLSRLFPLPLSPVSSGFTSMALKQTELADLLRPLSEQIQKVQSFREKHRGSSLFNHLSAVSESIPALGWVAMVRP